MAKSEERTGPFGGRYTEHYDDDGTKVGESHRRDGLFGGSYVEHQSTDGRVTGESHEREGPFGGRYVQHYDHEHGAVGESVEREGLFGGRYTQHYDEEHREVGRSVERQGVFGGTYTEHTGSGGAVIAASGAGHAGGSAGGSAGDEAAGSTGGGFELSDLFAGGAIGLVFRLLALGICFGSGYVFTTVADPYGGLWWTAVVAFFLTVIPALTLLLSALVVMLGIAAIFFIAQFVWNLVF